MIIKVWYTNYRGETSLRTVTPKKIWLGKTEYHPEEQWIITAYDHDKKADRDFAMADFGEVVEEILEEGELDVKDT